MKKYVRDYAFVMVGAFLASLAIQIFLLPMKISTGGISGVATVLFYLFRIPLPLPVLLSNLLLLGFGASVLSRDALPKNLAGVFFLSLFLKLFENLPGYTEDIWIASVFGGALAGVGVGISMRYDASTGGTDFAALMLHKKIPHISPAFFIMAMDTVIIFVSGIAFRDITVMFYSILSLYISNKVVDAVLVWGSFAKTLIVISEKNQTIAQRILTEVSRGVTEIAVRGGYTKKERNMLYCVAQKRQIPALLDLIKETDPAAFTVVSDARQVRGEGFDKK